MIVPGRDLTWDAATEAWLCRSTIVDSSPLPLTISLAASCCHRLFTHTAYLHDLLTFSTPQHDLKLLVNNHEAYPPPCFLVYMAEASPHVYAV